MVEINADDPRCPICESSLLVYGDKQQFILRCHNTCFKFEYLYGDCYCYIFGRQFSQLDLNTPVIPNGVSEEVLYWKDNYRYLPKILEGNK